MPQRSSGSTNSHSGRWLFLSGVSRAGTNFGKRGISGREAGEKLLSTYISISESENTGENINMSRPKPLLKAKCGPHLLFSCSTLRPAPTDLAASVRGQPLTQKRLITLHNWCLWVNENDILSVEWDFPPPPAQPSG